MLSRFEKFIVTITEIDLYWHRLASVEMGQYGLKGNYAVYFTRLHNAPEGLTAAQLAVACGKDKADVSRDISALEKAGLVERSSGYRAPITLTEQGNALTEEIVEKATLAVSCIGSGITESDRDTFYRVLEEINTNLQTLSQSGLPCE